MSEKSPKWMSGGQPVPAARRIPTVTFQITKEEILLTPMSAADLDDFGGVALEHRLRNGGLPPVCLTEPFPERECQEWIDSFWAKDVQELFPLERRRSFQRFLELLFIQSGGMYEAASFAKPCQVSRTTIHN